MKNKELEVKEIIVETEKLEKEPSKVGRLDLSFPNEDLNKLVSKINEIIESL